MANGDLNWIASFIWCPSVVREVTCVRSTPSPGRPVLPGINPKIATLEIEAQKRTAPDVSL